MKQLEAYFSKDVLAAQGETPDQATQALRNAVGRFTLRFSQVPEDSLFVPIGPNRWSPAEYADHVYRATLLHSSLIERTCAGKEPRKFERDWLRSGGRMISISDAHPVAGRNRDELIRDLQAATDDLLEAALNTQEQGQADFICHINSLLRSPDDT